MNEQDWLASNRVGPMLRHLTHEVHSAPGVAVGDHRRERPLISQRKLKLFEEACWAAFKLNLEDMASQDTPTPEGASLLREIVGNPLRPIREARCANCRGTGRVTVRGELLPGRGAETTEIYAARGAICTACDGDGKAPGLLSDYLTPTVRSLAQTAYDERGRKCGRCDGKGHVEVSMLDGYGGDYKTVGGGMFCLPRHRHHRPGPPR